MKNNKVEMTHMHKTRKTKALVPLERALYLLHPDNASLITCKGRNEEINVMAVAWIIPVSVNPPLLAMIITTTCTIKKMRCEVIGKSNMDCYPILLPYLRKISISRRLARVPIIVCLLYLRRSSIFHSTEM